MLGHLPHRSLQNLAKKYGPIMSMKLGSKPAIIVSSPEAAELFLKTHDILFASRPKIQASDIISYGSRGLVFSEYGPFWRNIRKLCTSELLSVAKIDSYVGTRKEEVEVLVGRLTAAREVVVDVTEVVERLIEDMTCRMMFGRCGDDRFDLTSVIHEGVTLMGAFNVADFVPFLGPFDLQGLTPRLKASSKAIDDILEIIIDDHVHKQEAKATNKMKQHEDFVDVMLSLINQSSSIHDELPYSIDRMNIKAIILDMIVGAIDTSSTAIEWIMSELLRHPQIMKKLQAELMSVVGGERMVEERDLAKLEYLDMVIKETLRLHPVAPLLVPRESTEEIVINEYFIHKKSRIIVNCWAIGRDPNVWSENVEEFFPERFIDSDIGLRGHHFQLLPFGSGRRGCPGMHLGLINVRLVVAQLVHCFDWELPNGMSPNELDMSEKFAGLAVPRANHLLAIPTYRLDAKNL
ncbi:Cytochrome P450 CYP736A12 like [Actinidia chinensis var. chinensis]|uniref:Cytochrome P450 CYP736A12 like n=1 Tax=Actinidia chinensis var. chinensis TaxID=1590841 RepID=A0A2R6QIE7_ACTCC|nr:Cytochrome P450 CYP736A12 like [Actinidia chinensis var. chinensis]